MAKPIYSLEHLTEQIEAQQPLRKVGGGHVQAKPRPAVTICASCKHQDADNFDVCNAAAWEGGPVGKVFVMWSCSGWESRNA